MINRDSHSFLVQIQNGTTLLEDMSAMSYKPVHSYHAIQQSHYGVFINLLEKSCPHENQHMNVSSSFILTNKTGSNQDSPQWVKE